MTILDWYKLYFWAIAVLLIIINAILIILNGVEEYVLLFCGLFVFIFSFLLGVLESFVFKHITEKTVMAITFGIVLVLFNSIIGILLKSEKSVGAVLFCTTSVLGQLICIKVFNLKYKE